jgi:hypothetical protein
MDNTKGDDIMACRWQWFKETPKEETITVRVRVEPVEQKEPRVVYARVESVEEKPRIVNTIVEPVKQEEPRVVYIPKPGAGQGAEATRWRELDGVLRQLLELCDRHPHLGELDSVKRLVVGMLGELTAGKGTSRGKKPATARRKKPAGKAAAPKGERKRS